MSNEIEIWKVIPESDGTTYATGWFTHKEIADAYDMKRQSIGDIITGRNWGHL